METISRRSIVNGGGATAGLLVAGRQGRRSTVAAAVARVNLPGGTTMRPQAFGSTLAIPPLLSPSVEDGTRTFDLTLQAGRMEFEPGNLVDTLGINGPYLGPTLRAARGDAVAFTVANRIGEPTTLHWHGMHLPAMMDGGPHQEIADGESWELGWTINQEAATLWYHPHLMGRTREQVTRGAVGLFILDDDEPAQTALPHDYGVDDIPLILQGYGVDDGRLGPGRQGGVLVNGALAPVLVTDQPRLRLWLLNATDDRIFSIGFVGDVPFSQVASDGGLLPAPVPLTRLQLGVAERAEIVVDLADAPDGTELVLQRFGGGGNGRGDDDDGDAGRGQGGALMTIQGPGQVTARAAELPAELGATVRFNPNDVAVARPMVLGGGGRGGRGGRTINGLSMTSAADMADMANTLSVRLGDLERWDVVNRSDDTHVFHVHDVQFQILERDGIAPGPTEVGRKDTVVVREGETVSLLMRFEDYADPEMPYMFHCHILQHEDQGMMGQFVVVPA